MRYVPRPVHDDYRALHLLARNHRLKSYPRLAQEEATVVDAYNRYVQYGGNALAIAPVGIVDLAVAKVIFVPPPNELYI